MRSRSKGCLFAEYSTLPSRSLTSDMSRGCTITPVLANVAYASVSWTGLIAPASSASGSRASLRSGSKTKRVASRALEHHVRRFNHQIWLVRFQPLSHITTSIRMNSRAIF